MPLIITATDFSEVSENAVNYACKLASLHNAQVIIIHSFIIPVMFSDIPMPASLVTDAQSDADIQMNKLVGSMKMAYPGLMINGKVIYGDTISVLEDYAQENKKPWLIVVGNSITTENSTWPDSTLMDAFKKLAYPVLAVPPGKIYQPLQNICFAFDNKHKGNEVALAQVKDITLQFNARLHVLNIQPGNNNQNGEAEIDPDAKNILADAKPEYHIVSGAENIDVAIHDFTERNNIDLLVMLPRKHSFFEGLFHKSHTKTITHHSSIPILAIHETKAE
jgi:nucleotide-binding universal stress UspA family protein